ncbi:MAG: ImuA family protein [Dongiaceae bacterium]
MTARIDLTQLKQRIARIPALQTESRAPTAVFSTGLPAVDAYLESAGVPLAAVHEVAGHAGDEEQGAAGAGFLTLMLKASATSGWIAWVTQDADLYAPGLAAFDLDLRRLILVSARRDAEVCWALEEALRSRALSAVAGEVGVLTLNATRRLQLAAEQAGLPCFLLRRWRTKDLAERQRAQPIAAVTRWRISPQIETDTGLTLAPELGRIRRRLDLWRCRNAQAASWIMEFDHADEQRVAAFPVAVPAALADRSIPATAKSQSAAESEAERAAATLLSFG